MKHLPLPLRWLIVMGLRAVAVTLRLRLVDPLDEMGAQGPPRIYAIWHNRLPLLPALLKKGRRRKLAFLASRSRDGGYIADILGTFGMTAVRGSTSRGGAMALRELRQYLDQGYSVGLTPDGPRGPRYEIQDGVIWLAARTGLAIVPVALNTESHWELDNWDRTQLPKPFSRGVFRCGDPIPIPAGVKKADLPAFKQQVRAAMLAICAGDHEPLTDEAELTAAPEHPKDA